MQATGEMRPVAQRRFDLDLRRLHRERPLQNTSRAHVRIGGSGRLQLRTGLVRAGQESKKEKREEEYFNVIWA